MIFDAGATRLIEQFCVKRNLYRVGDDINDDENENMVVNGHESCVCLERKRLNFRLDALSHALFHPDIRLTRPQPSYSMIIHSIDD